MAREGLGIGGGSGLKWVCLEGLISLGGSQGPPVAAGAARRGRKGCRAFVQGFSILGCGHTTMPRSGVGFCGWQHGDLGVMLPGQNWPPAANIEDVTALGWQRRYR